MPYLPRDRFADAYAEILNASLSSAWAGPSTSSRSTASVLLLVAPDVDAICACRGLVKLLTDDRVGFTVRPVSGWADLARINHDDIEGNTELRAVVLLNIGALIDLSEYFSLPRQATLHVFDSHRPWNLNNVFDSGPEAEQVCVWDDGDIEDGLKAEQEAYEALQVRCAHYRRADRQYEPESDSDDSDADSDGDLPRRRRADSDDEDEDRANKRRRLDGEGGSDPQRMSRKQRRTLNARINKYYNSGTYHGQSIANLVFLLATMLDRVDNDILWLAILGLTYQFTAGLIDNERYERFSAVLADEVARLNVTGIEAPPDGATSGSSPTDRSIRPSTEFRFMLFRHWNLYDAMYHSSYVAGKLRLWRERGRKNLQGLLAKMGCVGALTASLTIQLLAPAVPADVRAHGHGAQADAAAQGRVIRARVRPRRPHLPLVRARVRLPVAAVGRRRGRGHRRAARGRARRPARLCRRRAQDLAGVSRPRYGRQAGGQGVGVGGQGESSAQRGRGAGRCQRRAGGSDSDGRQRGDAGRRVVD